ncbi:glycosyltransferase family 2 protein [Pseudoxanthomonas taiwanensis]|jgi:Glycosyltransferases involved in cell wall biogenesis|uniref:Dolichyl-phosphate mannose synthase n=1 Tax=Pseudoxanthomonas taiwanensis TaxID=176598 RepID=A0A921NVQ1_9GAMM|nr:glycosyltransferase family 2 protein [Pseudoxanthomonas taiwanensis]KAF1688943.1 dolichyl-phosphate mannose synthase [Pseudoxanthomonas taiwanensis]MBO2467369.1 dolichyl-phosphate mannose synthase [Xanthomonadaceae bacterium]
MSAGAGSTAVVIPALNEALRIRPVVERTLRHCPWVIVVDDGSHDGTAECIADLPVTVLRHPRRRGKGAALRTGFAAALAGGATGVLTLDGDGQHDPDDLPRLLRAAQRHPRHIIIGARLRHRAQAPLHRRLANAFGDWGVAWAAGYRIADTQSGQRYYPAEVVAMTDVPGEDFVYETQLLISASRRLGIRAVSIPVETRYCDEQGRRFRRSHFRPLRDLYRITSHVVGQVLAHGRVWHEYRQARANPPRVDTGV